MRIVALSALSLLSGCSIFIPQWEGVWLLQMPEESDGSTALDFCEADCDSNFSDADCPDTDVDEGDWTYEVSEKLSAGAYFIQIFKGKGGEVFAVIDDKVYLGDATVKELSLTWKGNTDSDDRQSNDNDYDYETIETSETLDKITLTKGGGEVKGSWTIQTSQEREWIETDEWDAADVGIGGGQIPSGQFLEPNDPGDNQNSADGDECSGGDCELSISSACDFGKKNFTVEFAGKYENGMFTGISKAKQPAGAQP